MSKAKQLNATEQDRADLIRRLIESTNGRFFRVTFRKRTTGKFRDMTAKLLSTRKDHRDNGKGLIRVYDATTKAPRFISLENIQQLAFDGQVVNVAEVEDSTIMVL